MSSERAMESTFSFLAIVGGQCGYERRDRKKSIECVPLLICDRDITGHKSTFGFYDIDTEIELTLARAGMFSLSQLISIEQFAICPSYRLSLGIGWKRSSDRCKVPLILSNHSEDIGKKPNAERGLSKADAQAIFKDSGVMLAVGSGA